MAWGMHEEVHDSRSEAASALMTAIPAAAKICVAIGNRLRCAHGSTVRGMGEVEVVDCDAIHCQC